MVYNLCVSAICRKESETAHGCMPEHNPIADVSCGQQAN